MKKGFGVLLVAAALFISASSAWADKPDKPVFGHLYYDGMIVRTVIPPAKMTKEGVDPIYPFTNGAEGQMPIAGVAPGDTDYHGGKWAVHLVTWTTEPMILTSEEEVWTAEAEGKLYIVRVPEADFKCPIQP